MQLLILPAPTLFTPSSLRRPTPLSAPQVMSHAIASSKAAPGFLARLSSRQCQRCYASSAMQPKQLRPTVPHTPMQSRQPIVQRRTKYKTIEQAKSRYSTGVCDAAARLRSW